MAYVRFLALFIIGATLALASVLALAAPSEEYKAAAAEYKRLCALDPECAEKVERKRELAAQRRLARKLEEIRALKSTH